MITEGKIHGSRGQLSLGVGYEGFNCIPYTLKRLFVVQVNIQLLY